MSLCFISFDFSCVKGCIVHGDDRAAAVHVPGRCKCQTHRIEFIYENRTTVANQRIGHVNKSTGTSKS